MIVKSPSIEAIVLPFMGMIMICDNNKKKKNIVGWGYEKGDYLRNHPNQLS